MQPQAVQQQAPVDIFLTHVPANLRAKFGRARCRELLADEAGVQRAWSRLLSESGGSSSDGFHGNHQMVQQRRPPQHLPPLRQQQQKQSEPDNWYAILSEQFNSDYSPGVAATRRLGHNHETHSEAAFQSSGLFNNSGGLHKRRRDDFATYNEIIHVERKFNNYWAMESAAGTGSSGNSRSLPRQPRQPPPPQHSTSILQSGGSGDKSAKRVTILGDQEPLQSGQQSLHRANTVQREA